MRRVGATWMFHRWCAFNTGCWGCRGKEVSELALQARDRTTHPTHQGMYKLSALEGGAGSWSS